MNEKPNTEVLDGGVPRHQDKLMLLDSGSLLITRIVPTKDNNSTFICIHKPLEIFNDVETGEIMVRDWIPESTDDFYFLPIIKVTNVSEPNPFFLDIYHKHIHVDNNGDTQTIH